MRCSPSAGGSDHRLGGAARRTHAHRHWLRPRWLPTEAVRRRPYAVVLLDEVEKAHPDVFNILLQVLDDGRLTDGQGRTVDFSNSVVVMTSNLGSDLIQSMVGESHDTIRDAVTGVVSTHFRPEFINRIDDAVVFHALGREHIRGILDVQLSYLRARLDELEYGFELTDEVAEKLCEAGYDPVYGARPLKRAIQVYLENPLAEALLKGQFAPGATIQAVLTSAGEMTFQT